MSYCLQILNYWGLGKIQKPQTNKIFGIATEDIQSFIHVLHCGFFLVTNFIINTATVIILFERSFPMSTP